MLLLGGRCHVPEVRVHDAGGRHAERDLAVEYLMFLRLVGDNSSGVPATLRPEATAPPRLRAVLLTKEVATLVSEFGDYVGRVEVLRDGQLQPLVFRIPDTVLRESETRAFKEMKAATLFTVPRENP